MRRESGLQKTIARQVSLSGIGVHSGLGATLTLHPADPDSGIIFLATDVRGREVEIAARHDKVCCTELCTRIGDLNGTFVSTIEHLMAAVAASGIDNIMIELDGDEVPIMDGSAIEFMEAIELAGVLPQGAPRKMIKVLKPVRVEQGENIGELLPCDTQRFEIAIDFADPLIGRQQVAFDLGSDVFRKHIARARTFGFMRDVERLWNAGFALGASLDNTVVIGENRIVNPEGLRFTDEFVRHKALDAVGDLALAGAPILGRYRSLRGGHKLNAAVVSALMADTSAWTYVETVDRPTANRGHAEIDAFVSAAAMGPDVS